MLDQSVGGVSGIGGMRLGGQVGLDALRLKLDSVRLGVQGAHLAVHRNLKQEGQCDPYVTVRVVPGNLLGKEQGLGEGGTIAVSKAKTKTQRRTLFPL